MPRVVAHPAVRDDAPVVNDYGMVVRVVGVVPIAGAVDQGNPGLVTAPWFFSLSDGANVIGVAGSPLVIGGAVDQGTAAAITAPWPTILSDGASAFGTAINPFNVVGAVTVSGAVDQGTAAVITAPWPVILSDGAVALGTAGNPIRVDTTGTTSQPVDDGGASLTVDGTVTANQGTAAVITAPWPTVLSDGAAQTGTAGNPLRTDPTGTTAQPVTDNGSTLSVDDGGSSLTVDGAVTANAPSTNTATITRVVAALIDTALLAANANRLGAYVANESTGTLYLKLGLVASVTDYTIKLFEDDVFQIPAEYKGAVNGIWSAAVGAAQVTEF